MLCKRLVLVLTFNDGVLFRTKLFTPDYRYSHRFVDSWLVDEMVLLDVTRGGSRPAFFRAAEGIINECFVPMTLGGGIRSIDDVGEFFDAGADKITVNTGALERPSLISDIAERYGNQAVVLSIDVKGKETFSHYGSKPTGLTAVEWAREGVERGAGEILLTSIERDGSLQGYDLETLQAITDAVNVPVMVLGGAGNWQHFVDGADAGADAVCTQIIHHFTKNSIAAAKRFMADKGVRVRNDPVLQDLPDAGHPASGCLYRWRV